MSTGADAPLSGRRAEAARNDERILQAAREVFVADPSAPIAAVAERAGVGISALYRRYESKEALLRTLCAAGLAAYVRAVERALAHEGDAWTAFRGFMEEVVVADTHSLTLRLAGTFAPTPDLYADAEASSRLTRALFERTREAGVLRHDVAVEDLSLLFEQLAAVRIGDDARTAELRLRHLALALDALQRHDAPPLPGHPPSWDEIRARWDALPSHR